MTGRQNLPDNNVLRLFKYYTKKLNTRARQYLYDAGETLQVPVVYAGDLRSPFRFHVELLYDI